MVVPHFLREFATICARFLHSVSHGNSYNVYQQSVATQFLRLSYFYFRRRRAAFPTQKHDIVNVFPNYTSDATSVLCVVLVVFFLYLLF